MSYYLKIGEQEVPVSKIIYKTWQKSERKERYFKEGDAHNGVFSYDALDGEGLNGCELFSDREALPVEKQAEANLLSELLKQAVLTLDSEERDLLLRIYYQDETLRKISQDTGIPFTTLHYRHKKILKKLNRFLEHKF